MSTHLPGVGPASIGGIRLPHGRPVYGDQPEGSPVVLWATDEPIEDFVVVWTVLRQPARELGVVPLCLSGLGGDPGNRPWESREFTPSASAADDLPTADLPTAAELLAHWWSMGIPDSEEDEDETAELLAPFKSKFPGLASPEDRAVDQGGLTAALRLLPVGRLGLVAAERPADALSVLGWHGAVNYDQDGDDMSIVLRSWEERFGATLVGVGFDTIHFLVARPPRTLDAAQRVAAEHFAFCSDSVYQGAGSISELADDLIDGTIWSFWWD